VAVSFKPIRPLLQTGTNAGSRWFSYIGLGIGVLLLLCSIQMYVNIQQLLSERAVEKGGYDFISISKTITNETMGSVEKNLFNEAEIKEVEAQPFITDAAPLIANNFRFQLTGGVAVPFMTDLFVESLENDFIDTVPPSFTWTEGQLDIPIILSSDFLELYNIFAPGYGLPQISQESALSLNLMLIFYYNNPSGERETFRGHIVAFSDRINSIIVPKPFLDWANNRYTPGQAMRASRLYIKTIDANEPNFLKFLSSKNYRVNKDKTKFGRVKMILQGVFGGLGIFGLMVVVLALMLFSFYLQLMIARSRDSLQLLLMIGYSPQWLGNNVSKQFIPVYLFIVLVALALTQAMQWAFHHFVMYDRPELSTPIHWSVAAIAALLVTLSLVTNYRLVRKLLYRLY
jgi:hypothetical protein